MLSNLDLLYYLAYIGYQKTVSFTQPAKRSTVSTESPIFFPISSSGFRVTFYVCLCVLSCARASSNLSNYASKEFALFASSSKVSNEKGGRLKKGAISSISTHSALSALCEWENAYKWHLQAMIFFIFAYKFEKNHASGPFIPKKLMWWRAIHAVVRQIKNRQTDGTTRILRKHKFILFRRERSLQQMLYYCVVSGLRHQRGEHLVANHA